MKKSKTEKKIQDALLLLLKTESINHITMSQIAQKANLNRVTLYRHYNDKWDILENIEQEFLHKLDTPHAKMITNLQLTTQSLHPHPNLRALTSFFKVFQDNFPLLQVLMGPNANLGFTNKLMTYLINLEEKSHPYIPVSIQKLNPDMFSYYSISSLIGIIQFWQKNQNYSPSQMAEFFSSLKFASVLLKNSKTNENKAKRSDKNKKLGTVKITKFFLIASFNKPSQNFYFSSF